MKRIALVLSLIATPAAAQAAPKVPSINSPCQKGQTMKNLIIAITLAALPVAAFAQQQQPSSIAAQLDQQIGSITSLLSGWKNAIIQQDAMITELNKQLVEAKAKATPAPDTSHPGALPAK